MTRLKLHFKVESPIQIEKKSFCVCEPIQMPSWVKWAVQHRDINNENYLPLR